MIRKIAGKWIVHAGTEGFPIFAEIRHNDGKIFANAYDQISIASLTVDDLKDLRYCLDEAISKIERLNAKMDAEMIASRTRSKT